VKLNEKQIAKARKIADDAGLTERGAAGWRTLRADRAREIKAIDKILAIIAPPKATIKTIPAKITFDK
jgi:hypothetical protein